MFWRVNELDLVDATIGLSDFGQYTNKNERIQMAEKTISYEKSYAIKVAKSNIFFGKANLFSETIKIVVHQQYKVQKKEGKFLNMPILLTQLNGDKLYGK